MKCIPLPQVPMPVCDWCSRLGWRCVFAAVGLGRAFVTVGSGLLLPAFGAGKGCCYDCPAWPRFFHQSSFRIRGAASASDFLRPDAACRSFGVCCDFAVCPVLRRGGALGGRCGLVACRSFGSVFWCVAFELRSWGFWGHVVVFSVRICKIFLFGVGGKSIETYLSAIDDLRPGLLLICPNLSGAVRAVITL